MATKRKSRSSTSNSGKNMSNGTPSSSGSNAPRQNIDTGIDVMLHKAEEGLARCLHDAEDCVRQAPLKSMAAAVAAGYFLRHLPIRALLVAKVRLLAALAPPALVMYGAAKVYEYLQEQSAQQAKGPNPDAEQRRLRESLADGPH